MDTLDTVDTVDTVRALIAAFFYQRNGSGSKNALNVRKEDDNDCWSS